MSESPPLNEGRRTTGAEVLPRVTPAHTVRSDVLLGGRQQIAIVHNHEVYFLRQTRLGKLILTK